MTDLNNQSMREPLYQVWATETKTGKLVAVPMFPRAMKEAVDGFVDTMKAMITLGKEKRYADPQALPHLGYSGPVPQ